VIRGAHLLVRAAVVAAAATAAVAVGAAPAAADVSISPTEAVRGDAVRLTFRVTDQPGAAYTTRVEVQLPTDTPIAEVYPLSVPGWGPETVTRRLDRPVPGLHSGNLTEVPARVVWTRAGRPRTPGAELTLSMGPLPDAERVTFVVVQTLSDGRVVRWDQQPTGATPSHPAAVLTLVAGSGPAEGQDELPPATEETDASSGPGMLGVGLGGLAVGAGLAAVAFAFLRRPGATAADAPPTTDAPPAADDQPAQDAADDQPELAPAAATPPAPRRAAWRLPD
jgi:uncharacterized protein YcnI